MDDNCRGNLFFDKGLRYVCSLDLNVVEIEDRFPESCPRCRRTFTPLLSDSIIMALKQGKRDKDDLFAADLKIERVKKERDALLGALHALGVKEGESE